MLQGDCVVEFGEDRGPKNMFCVSSVRSGNLYLFSETEGIRKQWMEVLEG